MRTSESFDQIYIARLPVDGRKFMDGLAAIVTAEFELNFRTNALFVFTNRKYDRVRCLYWDRTGFALWFKRLEKGRFPWPKSQSEMACKVTSQQLGWLLDGIDFTKLKPHKTLQYSTFE
jgi:transposase